MKIEFYSSFGVLLYTENYIHAFMEVEWVQEYKKQSTLSAFSNFNLRRMHMTLKHVMQTQLCSDR